MAWSALALRCLLVLAFCLDGGVSLWKASAMATDMAERAAAVTTPSAAAASADPVHHGPSAVRSAYSDCETRGTFSSSNTDHQDCDCDADGGCACPCTFAVKLLAHEVPFAAQHRPPMQPAEAQQEAPAQAQTATLFRPPIA
jgi:hypothetical protein